MAKKKYMDNDFNSTAVPTLKVASRGFTWCGNRVIFSVLDGSSSTNLD